LNLFFWTQLNLSTLNLAPKKSFLVRPTSAKALAGKLHRGPLFERQFFLPVPLGLTPVESFPFLYSPAQFSTKPKILSAHRARKLYLAAIAFGDGGKSPKKLQDADHAE
jgi:hypothetical protein